VSLAAARRLWGAEAVAGALAHPAPHLSRELLDTLCSAGERFPTDADLAAWGRGLEPAAFAAVVRLVAGLMRAELLATVGGAH